MPPAVTDELAQDFLIEAGEIVEALGEQLVELEQAPDDADLVNAVFRGFHTIKGGAGFMNLTAVVELCHLAEELFGMVREGKRSPDPELMDRMHQSVDELTGMLDTVGEGEQPASAPADLLAALQAAIDGDAAEPPAAVKAQAAEALPQAPPAVDAADAAFDALLGGDEPEPAAAAQAAPAATSDDITEDEFESLLDNLHGGAAPGSSTAAPEPAKPAAAKPASDDIDEAEFEALLDELHGKGKGPTAASADVTAPDAGAAPAVAAKPAVSAATEKPTPSTPAKPKAAKTAKGSKTADTSVRVDTRKLDGIMNLVGELVLVRNRFKALRAVLDDDESERVIGSLDIITAQLQGAVMQTRMQPVGKVFSRFPKLARDVARSLNKQINLELQGEDTDLDKNLVEALADPLVHLVRNAIDHGIESPEVRHKRGKPPQGQVLLSAQQEGDHILITIQDDGAGIDPELLRQKARDKGLITPEESARLDEEQCFQLIFLPGFSTKSEVSDISGRGVGMDVVKTKITKLNGSISIKSQLGLGSTFLIRVPLTLAILPTLMVTIAGRAYALPLAAVLEVFSFKRESLHWMDGKQVIDMRGETVPIVPLDAWLDTPSDRNSSEQHVVLAQVGEDRFGFIVDDVRGREEVVIKPLGALLNGLTGFAGATITGDGRIALILDMASLLKARSYIR